MVVCAGTKYISCVCDHCLHLGKECTPWGKTRVKMTFTLEELQHILGAMNGGWIDDGCEVCSSARKKLEVMIAELKSSPRKGDTYEKPVPEWMKDLGVSKIDVVIE